MQPFTVGRLDLFSFSICHDRMFDGENERSPNFQPFSYALCQTRKVVNTMQSDTTHYNVHGFIIRLFRGSICIQCSSSYITNAAPEVNNRTLLQNRHKRSKRGFLGRFIGVTGARPQIRVGCVYRWTVEVRIITQLLPPSQARRV